MKHLTILLSMLMLTSASVANAQEDDMYFSPKKAKKAQATHKVEVVYEDESPEEYRPVTVAAASGTGYAERDVDEYNRRGRSTQTIDAAAVEDDENTDTRQARTYELSSQNLYDLGYSEGYRQGFDDGEDLDYYYGVRLARFHGRHFYDPWYWGSISIVYDPWYWDPWYCDPWFRPYYYGGWCSVGWGIGHWGSYWHPYWHGWHTPYPYYHHHSGWGHWGGSYGPRYSTVRNRDYGRARIIDRSTRMGDTGRYGTRGTGNNITGNRTGNRASDRNTRLNQRSVDRYNRVTERAGNRTTIRDSRGTTRTDRSTVRTNRGTTRTDRSGTINRHTNRSSERTDRSTTRSSSRIGSSSSSMSRGSGGFGGGHSMGGSRGGGGGTRGGGGRGR